MDKGKMHGFPVMEHMSVNGVEEYMRHKQSIILPIGVIEQHGHHLPLETDALIARNISWLIGEKIDMLVAPTMYQSFSGGGCQGTINISPSVMSLVIRDTLVSLASQGFRNFYLFLAHGGSENARALDDTLKLLLRLNTDFKDKMIALLPVWDFDADGVAWKKSIPEHDWHAGWLETSMVMALEPDKVHMDELAVDDEPALSQQIEHPDNYQHAEKIVDDRFVIPRMTQRPDVKIGVMGYPERATLEIGQKAVESIVKATVEKILELEAKYDGVYKEVSYTPTPLIFDEPDK